MAKNSRLAEKRRKKALKRAERKRRKAESSRGGGLSFSPVDRPIEDFVADEENDDDDWLPDEDDMPPVPLAGCSWIVAGELADDCEERAQSLEWLDEEVDRHLAAWPDAPRTQELRTLLLEAARLAAEHRVAWEALASRFHTLSEHPDHHTHLDRGSLVPQTAAHDPDPEDIPF